MSPRRTPPGGAALPLLHWLLLVCGLAAITALRIDDVERTLPLWIGGVLGTALGQLFAKLRLRSWAAAFLALNAMWVGAIVLWPLMVGVPQAGTAIQAYAPAVVCGYLSMSERGTLAAFWFPAVLWTLAILHVDPTGRAALGSTASWLLLGGLGMLLLATLWAREARRIAEWKTHATVSLAEPGGRAVLREAPLRGAARLGWVAALGAATILMTAWVAPHLRQRDASIRAAGEPGGASGLAASSGTAGAPGAATCCPEAPVAERESERVREYFALVDPVDCDTPSPPPQVACVPCRRGVPIETGASGLPGGGGAPGAGDPASSTKATHGAATDSAPRPTATAPVASSPQEPATNVAPVPPPPRAPEVAPAQVKPEISPPPRTASPAANAARPAEPSKPVAQPAIAAPSTSPIARATTIRPVPSPRARTVAAPQESHLLEWLLALSASALGIHLGLRPLRRWITLRHLRRPFWSESVDQRVSNLWQLVLVGLRDAGWRVLPGEQPQELARRVRVDGMETCATVLERARHGVRVDAADLEAMEGAAGAAYGAARGRVGWAARAVGWWRWPLV